MKRSDLSSTPTQSLDCTGEYFTIIGLLMGFSGLFLSDTKNSTVAQ